MGLVDPDARPIRIPFGQSWLDADLIAGRSQGSTIIFAHGSGSGRRSPRNRQVATRLRAHGFGTLLLDLLTESEARNDEITAEHRFNIPLLTERLLVATDWLIAKPEGRGIPIGYFGASTGGAVAMIAAAQRPESVGAIVLRGARSDLGDSAAPRIRCPTLLIAGENDALIRRANERTLELLRCEKQLEVIPDASHLFEEPGALETVAERTSEWFGRYLFSVQK